MTSEIKHIKKKLDIKDDGLKIWSAGSFFTKDGTFYHKVVFMAHPIIETNKRLIGTSGINIHDNIQFQISLTPEQILDLRPELEHLIKNLNLERV